MLEGWVRSLMSRYLGNILENVDQQEMSLQLASGLVRMNNVTIKPTFLASLALPLPFPAGFHTASVKELQVSVNWKQITTQPLHIHLNGIYIFADAHVYSEIDGIDSKWIQKQLSVALNEKAVALAKDEKANLEQENNQNSSHSTDVSFKSILLARLLAFATTALQFSLTDLHVCVRVPSWKHLPGMTLGIILSEIKLETTDSSFNTGTASLLRLDTYKLISVADFGIYINTDKQFQDTQKEHIEVHPSISLPSVDEVLTKYEEEKHIPHSLQSYDFMVAPVNIFIRSSFNKNAIPKLNLRLNIEVTPLRLKIAQPVVNAFQQINSIVSVRQVQVMRFTKMHQSSECEAKEIMEEERQQYRALYKRKLNAFWLPKLQDDERLEMQNLESKLHLNELLLLRHAVTRELKAELGEEKLKGRVDALNTATTWWERLLGQEDFIKENLESTTTVPAHVLTEEDKQKIFEIEREKSKHTDVEELMVTAADLLEALSVDLDIGFQLNCIRVELWKGAETKVVDLSTEKAQQWIEEANENDLVGDSDASITEIPAKFTRSTKILDALMCLDLTGTVVRAKLSPHKDFHFTAGFEFLSIVDFSENQSFAMLAEGGNTSSNSREFISIGFVPKDFSQIEQSVESDEEKTPLGLSVSLFRKGEMKHERIARLQKEGKPAEEIEALLFGEEAAEEPRHREPDEKPTLEEETRSKEGWHGSVKEIRTNVSVEVYKLHVAYSPVIFELAEFFRSPSTLTGTTTLETMKSLQSIMEYDSVSQYDPQFPRLESMYASVKDATSQSGDSSSSTKEFAKQEVDEKVQTAAESFDGAIRISTIGPLAYLAPMAIQVRLTEPIIQLVASPHAQRSATGYIGCDIDVKLQLNPAEDSFALDVALERLRMMACDTNRCDISYIKMPTSKAATVLKPFNVLGSVACYPSSATNLESGSLKNNIFVKVVVTPIKLRILSRLIYLCAPVLNQLKNSKHNPKLLDKESSQERSGDISPKKEKEHPSLSPSGKLPKTMLAHKSTDEPSSTHPFGPLKFACEDISLNFGGIQVKLVDDLNETDTTLLRILMGETNLTVKSSSERRDVSMIIPITMDAYSASLQVFEPIMEHVILKITASQVNGSPSTVTEPVRKSNQAKSVGLSDAEIHHNEETALELERDKVTHLQPSPVPATISLRANKVIELTVTQCLLQDITSYATGIASLHEQRLQLADSKNGYQLSRNAHEEYTLENWTQFELKFTAFSKNKEYDKEAYFQGEDVIIVPPFSSQPFSLLETVPHKGRMFQWQLKGAQSSITTSITDLRCQRYHLNWESIPNLQQVSAFVHVCTDVSISGEHKGTRLIRIRSPLGFLNSSDRNIEINDIDEEQGGSAEFKLNDEAYSNYVVASKALHFFPLKLGDVECSRRTISVRPCPVSVFPATREVSSTVLTSTSTVRIRTPAVGLFNTTENIPTSIYHWSPPCHLRANASLFVCSQPSSISESLPSTSAVSEIEDLDAVSDAAIASTLAQVRARQGETKVEDSSDQEANMKDFGRISERVKKEIWAHADKALEEQSEARPERTLKPFCAVLRSEQIYFPPQSRDEEAVERTKKVKGKKDKKQEDIELHSQEVDRALENYSTVTVRSEEARTSENSVYPDAAKPKNSPEIDDYGILVQLTPPLIFENLLACDVDFGILERIEDSAAGIEKRFQSRLPRGQEINVHGVIPSFPIYLTLDIPTIGCKHVSPVLINPSELQSNEKEKVIPFTVRGYDNNRELQLNLAITKGPDMSLRAIIYASWWLFDLTAVGINISASENELFPEIVDSLPTQQSTEDFDNRKPLMFSLNDSDSIHLQAKALSFDPNIWSAAINLKKFTEDQITAPLSLSQTKRIMKEAGGDSERLDDEGQLVLFGKTYRALGKFYRTKILTVQPQFFFVNQTKMEIRVHQVGEPNLNSSIIESNQQGELHWASKRGDKRICVLIDASKQAIIGEDKWHWSCPINPNELGQFDLAIRHIEADDEFRYLRIVTHAKQNSFYMHIQELCDEQLLPYCIQNESSAMIRFRQLSEERSDLKWVHVLPGQTKYFALESPFEDSKIFVEGARHTLIDNMQYVQCTEINLDGADKNFGGFGLDDESYENRGKSEDMYISLKTENATQVLLICDHPISEDDLIRDRRGVFELSSLSPSQLYDGVQEISKRIETTEKSILTLMSQKDAVESKLSASIETSATRPSMLPRMRSYVSVQIVSARNIPSKYGSVNFEISFDRNKSKGRTQNLKNNSRYLRISNNANFLFDATDFRHGVVTINMYTSRLHGFLRPKLIGTAELYMQEIEDVHPTQRWLTLVKRREGELFSKGEINVVFRWISEDSSMQSMQLNQIGLILHEKQSQLVALKQRKVELQTELDTKMRLQPNVEFLADSKAFLETNQAFPNVIISVHLPGIGLSIIDDVPSEISYISIFDLNMLLQHSEEGTRVQLEVGRLQIDDQSVDSLFPVVFSHTPESASGYPFTQITFDILPQQDTSIIVIDNAAVRIQEMDVKVDERFLYEVLEIVNAVRDYVIKNQEDQQFIRHYSELRGPESPSAEKQYFFKLLQFYPLAINITFEAKPGLRESYFNLGAWDPVAWGMSLGGAVLGSLHNAPLKLSGRSMEHMRGTVSVVGKTIFTYYRQEIIIQALKAAGYLDIAGQPWGMVSKIGHSIKDFFVLPVQGAKAGHPLKGLKEGIMAPVKATFSAVSLPVGHVGASIAKGMAAISNDREFIRSEEETSVEPKTVSEGLSKGTEQFGKGFSEGITGVVADPIKGAEKEGATGALKGAAKGAVGLATKPISGMASLFGQGFKGIGHAGESLGEEEPIEVKPVRARRYISEDGYVGPYESMGPKNERNTELNRSLDDLPVKEK